MFDEISLPQDCKSCGAGVNNRKKMILNKNKIVTKFNYKAYLLPILILASLFFPIILSLLIESLQYTSIESFLILWCFPIVIVPFCFYQIRFNILLIEFISDKIIVCTYFGFGKKKIIAINEFDGYFILNKESKGEIYEIIKLQKSNKHVANISQFYISNYLEIKNKIEEGLLKINENSF